MKPSLLSTKVLSKKHQLALRKHFSYQEIPALDFIGIPFDVENIKDKNLNLIFSSPRAVYFFKKMLLQKDYDLKLNKCYCVGENTALVAKKLGFYIECIHLTAESLANHLVLKSINNLAFICGNKRLDTIPNKLKENHINYLEFCVYKTKLTYPKTHIIPNYILFFSPSGVLSYKKYNVIKKTTKILALGKTTQRTIENHFKKKAFIPKYPTLDLLIIKAIETLNLSYE